MTNLTHKPGHFLIQVLLLVACICWAGAESRPLAAHQFGFHRIPKGPSAEKGLELLRTVIDSTDEELKAQQHSSDTTIALAAAWERLKRDRKTDILTRVDRFLGFFEGRARVDAPQLWELGIASRLMGRESYKSEALQRRFGAVSGTLHEWMVLKSFDGTLQPVSGGKTPRIPVTISDGSVQVTIDGALFRMHAPGVREKLKWPGYQCAAVRQGGKWFAAVFSKYDDERYRLYCFDESTETLLWQVDVWASGRENGPVRIVAGGTGWHDAALTVDDNHVTVFGLNNIRHCYVEAFDVSSGKNVYRFATNNWFMVRDLRSELQWTGNAAVEDRADPKSSSLGADKLP